jgi:GntR family transcriptional repressor for pyruvate dehydrogenase complex
MYNRARNNTLSQDVVSQLSRMILDGSIKKGEYLPSESQLCRLFGVSRTTVRSALSTLAQRKIIDTRRGKGSLVIADDFPYLNDKLRSKINEFENNFLYAVEIRRMLEPQIAREAACHATAHDIKMLFEIIEDCERKDREGTLRTEDMRKFHIKLASTMNNPVLTDLVESLICSCDAPPDTSIRVPNPGTLARADALREHHMIFDAIREHRADDAYYLMRENIKTFERNCMDEF